MRWIIHPEVRAEVRALEFCRELLGTLRHIVARLGTHRSRPWENSRSLWPVLVSDTEAEEGIPDLNSSPGSLPVQPPPLHQPALSERRRKLAADPALGEPCRILRSDPEWSRSALASADHRIPDGDP